MRWKSQHRKKLCLSLLMLENLKLKKVIKSFVPEPISCFRNPMRKSGALFKKHCEHYEHSMSICTFHGNVTTWGKYNKLFSPSKLYDTTQNSRNAARRTDEIHHDFLKHLPKTSLKLLLRFITTYGLTGNSKNYRDKPLKYQFRNLEKRIPTPETIDLSLSPADFVKQ